MHGKRLHEILSEVNIPDTWGDVAYEAIKFFLVFSRLEYSLKKAGFIIWDGEGRLGPDWKQFCRHIDGYNIEDNEYMNCAEYISQNPPKKQIISNGGMIVWKGVGQTDPKNKSQLIDHIRRLRNNLFHGGKGDAQGIRDNELLRCATYILLRWLDANTRVQNAYLTP